LKKTIKIKILSLCAIISLHVLPAMAQLPTILWSHKFGGTGADVPYSIKITADGGTIAAGYTTSKDGIVGSHTNRDYWDLWVVKISKCGELQWQLSLGGNDYESARDIIQTPDGGYFVVGETNSTDGDVIAGYGGSKDIWLLKLDASGNLQWQKRYGGSGLDIGNNIQLMPDGNYLIAASTSSNDGNFTGNHGSAGYTDGALMKIDISGNVLWTKCYGGSKNDELLDIEIIGDKIFVAGYANSIDGDIPATQKNYDVWLLCTDMNGNKSFSKIYGGSQNDVAYSMCRGNDNTLTLAGYTTSNDGNVTGAKGSQDFWIVNVSQTGVLKWQKTAGGTDAEYANSIIADSDGGYIAGGISYSEDGDVDNQKGNGDYWVIKLNAIGQIQWKQNYGGSETDHLHSIAFNPDLNEYYLSGDAASVDGDFTDGNADTDFGIIKLKLPNIDTIVCESENTVPDTLQDICGYDSVIIMCRKPTREEAYAFQQVRVPNAFTPNGDGKNDEFGAAGNFVTDFTMQIFNRYGQLVFQSNAINKKWNGVFRGTLQTTGTYIYSIRYIDNNKRIQLLKGAFTLIR
jgi:gliding motility-associated-like protein